MGLAVTVLGSVSALIPVAAAATPATSPEALADLLRGSTTGGPGDAPAALPGQAPPGGAAPTRPGWWGAGPYLVIETGAHAAAVRRIGIHRPSGTVITVADDKSARIWDLASGDLKRVFRPSIGPSRRGALHGVAPHPTEDLVALGGNTGDFSGWNRILMVRPSDGSLVAEFDARGAFVRKLGWSGDASVLFAVYEGEHAVRAFSPDGRLLYEARLRTPATALSVVGGRAVAAAADGEVLVLDARAGKVVEQRRFRRPDRSLASVALSPDGSRVAIGYRREQTPIDIVGVADGSLVAELAPPRLAAGSIQNVAWSADGRSIYAAGRGYESNPTEVAIFRYDAASQGLVARIAAAHDSVLELEPLADGRLAFGAFDGSWGIIERDRVALESAGALPDLRGADRLRLSDSGRVVGWADDAGGREVHFDFDTRLFSRQAARVPLNPPVAKRGLIDANRWRNERAPVVNGQALVMGRDELSLSLTHLRQQPDDVIVGTQHRLLRLDGRGAVSWQVPMASEVRAVNTSADDRFVVTAMSDGTLRWWRASDGRPVLTLMVARDGRWVAWTPSGDFDASPGADRLVGWAVNRTETSGSDFVSLNRFADSRNRPDAIDGAIGVPMPAAAPSRASSGSGLPGASPASATPTPSAGAGTGAQAGQRPAGDGRPASAPKPVGGSAASLPGTPATPSKPPGTPGAGTPAAAAPSPSPSPSPSPAPAPAPAPVPVPAPSAAPAAVPSAVPAKAPSVASATRPPATARPDGDDGADGMPTAPTLFPPVARWLGTPTADDGRGRLKIPIGYRTRGGDSALVQARFDGRPAPLVSVLPHYGRVDPGERAVAVEVPLPPEQAVIQILLSDRNGTSEPLILTYRPAPSAADAAPRTDSGAIGGSLSTAPGAPGTPAPSVRADSKRPPERVDIGLLVPAAARPPASGGSLSPNLPAPAPPREPGRPTARLFLLSIGISDYQRTEYNLRLAAKDAGDFAQAMREQSGRLYAEVHTRVLTNERANRDDVQAGLDWIANASASGDIAMVFIAGHGLNDSSGRYHFLPHDGDHRRLGETAVSEEKLRTTLSRIKGRVLMFVDTCYGGAVLRSEGSTELRRVANSLAAPENGVIVFASSSGRQESLESDEWGNGAFTLALVAGLRGEADPYRHGRITYKSLDLYVSERVTRLTEGKQTPVTISPIGVPDFLVAIQ